MSKEVKQVAIIDTGKDSSYVHAVLDFVKEKYDLIEVHPNEADYIFHSCMGNDVLKYRGVRIFITGEYVSPNFNISDYALAFDYLQFGDRYCRLPLIKLFRDAYACLCAPRPPADTVLAKKTGFCAYVMSNTKNSAPEREMLVNALETYKPVAMGGKWCNNVGGPVADKIAFQSAYKFVFAIENYSAPGYLTEKFAQAAESNAIPIYWGDPSITQCINPKSFINCHDFSSMEALVARIRELDQDDEAFRAILAEPWFINGEEPPDWRDATFTDFIRNIFDQPQQTAYRRNRSRWGIKYEKQYYQMAFRPLKHSIKKFKKVLCGN